MPTVAEQLRSAREARRLTIQEVAEVTKMRTDHVRALESGDYDFFVAPVYIRGFVRGYAQLLKLEPTEIMRTLDEELARTEKFAEPPSLMGEERTPLDFLMLQLSRIHWRVVLPVTVLLLVLFIAFWAQRAVSTRRARNPAAGVEPALYQPARPSPGNTLPLPAPTPSPGRR